MIVMSCDKRKTLTQGAHNQYEIPKSHVEEVYNEADVLVRYKLTYRLLQTI